VIPLQVEADDIFAIINLPKEMSNNGIFKNHRNLIQEMVWSVVLLKHYTRATQEDLPEE